MRGRLFGGLLLAVIAMLAVTTSAVAGGSATVEMDEPVTRVDVGEEMTLDFMLLQHGVTPTDWTTTYFEATNLDTGETLRVDATAGTETGRWSVVVAFPSAGNWDWAIQTEELHVEDTFPALEVVGDAAAVGNTSGVTPAQLDAALVSATDPLTEQISSISSEMDTLQKQVTSLSGERDVLQKQITNLESALAEQPATDGSASDGSAWWTAALAGAAAALVVVAGGTLFAMRRGLIRTRELSPATA